MGDSGKAREELAENVLENGGAQPEATAVHYQSIACDDYDDEENEEDTSVQEDRNAIPSEMCNQLTEHILSRMEYDYFQTVYAERKCDQIEPPEQQHIWNDAGDVEAKSDQESDHQLDTDMQSVSDAREASAEPRIAPLTEEKIASIQTIMGGIKLPNAIAPAWADGIDWQSQQVQDYLSSLQTST